jgi:hypothetical protein
MVHVATATIEMQHRRKGECERCNDIGVYGHGATHAAWPQNPTWPTFRVCLACAVALRNWPDGVERATKPYLILAIRPVN